MSDEQESGDSTEQFIVKFNNCGFTHYVGPFSTQEAARKYPAHLAIFDPKETVLVEVFELRRPVHYGPPQGVIGGTDPYVHQTHKDNKRPERDGL